MKRKMMIKLLVGSLMMSQILFSFSTYDLKQVYAEEETTVETNAEEGEIIEEQDEQEALLDTSEILLEVEESEEEILEQEPEIVEEEEKILEEEKEEEILPEETPESTPEIIVEEEQEEIIEELPEEEPQEVIEEEIIEEPEVEEEILEPLEEEKEEELEEEEPLIEALEVEEEEEKLEEEELVDASSITPGTNKSSAVNLPIGTTYNDSSTRREFTGTGNKKYWFKFSVSSTDVAQPLTFYELRVYNRATTGAINSVSMLKSDGTTDAVNEWDVSFIDDFGSIDAGKMNIFADKLKTAGTYYVVIETQSGFNGKIELGLSKKKDDVGTSTNAMNISFGTSYTKEVSGKNDFDHYSFTPATTGKFKITFKNNNYLFYNANKPDGDNSGFMVVGIGDAEDSYKMYWNGASEADWDGMIYSGQSGTAITELELQAGKKYQLYVGGDFSKFSDEKRNEFGSYTFKVEPLNGGSTKVTGVKLNKPSTTLELGKSETLKATVSPSDAANKKVTWSSSNKNVATVDSNGKITTKNGGTTVITVKTADGGKTAKCTVTVNMPKVQAVAIYNSAHGADIRFKPVSGVKYYGIWRKRTNPVTKVLEEKIVMVIDINKYTTKEGGNYKWIDPYLKDKYTDKGKEWEGGWVYYVTARSTDDTSKQYNDGKHLTIDGPISNKLNIYRLRNPEILSVTNAGSGKLTVSWSNVPTAHAYEVQYTIDNGATWTKVPEVVAAYWDENGKEVKVPTYKPSVTISNLPKGKKVNFRIRCRKTNTSLGVTWSEYSSWKSGTP